jgi:hypothetical protein
MAALVVLRNKAIQPLLVELEYRPRMLQAMLS